VPSGRGRNRNNSNASVFFETRRHGGIVSSSRSLLSRRRMCIENSHEEMSHKDTKSDSYRTRSHEAINSVNPPIPLRQGGIIIGIQNQNHFINIHSFQINSFSMQIKYSPFFSKGVRGILTINPLNNLKNTLKTTVATSKKQIVIY
jgi:hypothetical protein